MSSPSCTVNGCLITCYSVTGDVVVNSAKGEEIFRRTITSRNLREAQVFAANYEKSITFTGDWTAWPAGVYQYEGGTSIIYVGPHGAVRTLDGRVVFAPEEEIHTDLDWEKVS